MSIQRNINYLLSNRKNELEKLIIGIEKYSRKKPKGYLEIMKTKDKYRYYIKQESNEKNGLAKENRVRTYVRNDKLVLAEKIAMRDYTEKLKMMAKKELHSINQLLKIYQDTTIEDYYNHIHPGRQKLCTPIVVSDESYADTWSKSRNQRVHPIPPEKPIKTENNEIVRSKSEKIIADKLKLMGVPYKYEEALILGGKTIYPDFTALNIKTRKQYYWEHFGIMDDPNYVEKALNKIELYNKNNIVLGDDLIVTFETADHLVSVEVVEGLIQKHLTSMS